METEYDNIAAALSWSLDQNEIELGLRLASAIGRFWCRRRYQKQGRRWLDALLAKAKDVPASVRARALYYAGAIADGMGDIARAEEVALESLKLYRAAGDDAGVARALFGLGGVAFARGEAARARTLYGEALELFRALGDGDLAALTLMHLGELALFAERDHTRATSLYKESLTLFREIGGIWGSTWCLWGLGSTALYEGDHERARGLFTEALARSRELENPWLVASLLEGLAGVITAQAQAERAARLWGAAEVLREEVAAPMSAYELAEYERAVGIARAQLDEATFAAAWEEGRGMTLGEAIDCALTEEPTAAPQPERASQKGSASLTPREREVAALVALGLTNRRIASELGVAERTVTTHVGKILKKRGLESQAQLAVWAAEKDRFRNRA